MTLFPPPPPNSEGIDTGVVPSSEEILYDTVSPPPPNSECSDTDVVPSSEDEMDTVPPPHLTVRV